MGSAADMALVPVRLASEPGEEEAPRPGRIQIEAGRVRLEVEPGADARLLRLILETVLR